MFNKLPSRITNYLKKNFFFLIFIVIFYFLLNFPLPYYIHTTGGLINLSDKVSIETEYQEKGTLNLTYVTEIRGNALSCLLSFVLPTWDLVSMKDMAFENESDEDIEFRNHLFLDEANQNAISVAYKAAHHDFTIKKQSHYVVYIDENATTDLKIGDQILSLNNNPINDLNDYIKVVQQSNLGDTLNLEAITKDKKTETKHINVMEIDKKKVTGIYFVTKYDYETNPKIELSFKRSESGPSGGLMTALSIYNKLTVEDITHGKVVVGTGTIDVDGNVGEISGIEYKLKGAVKEKGEIFLVPAGSNYNEAIALKKKNHYDIIIISVSTFDDALNYLKSLGED